jgi:ABC-type transport system involved in multi-copper enzyme maturation permease subunit
MPVALSWLLRLGPANPIAVRLVQNGSRRTKHLYLRMAYLGVLIAVLLWALLVLMSGDQMNFRDLAAQGATAFKYIAFLQVALICILAPVFMAGAIAQEADPRTWDILLTTPLGATQIVLGNLFGRLFFILALLVSSLPLFAITQYFGGVPGDRIFLSYLIAACAALVVGSAAVALSVSRVVGKRAVFAFYVSVISYLAVTAGADAVIRAATGNPGVTYMTAINPFLTLSALLQPSTYPVMPPGTGAGLEAWFLERPVLTSLIIAPGLSVLLIAASIVTVRIGGIAGVGGLGGRTGTASGPAPWYRRMLGLGAAGSETRPARAVWANPISWREAASRNATLGRILARYAFIAAGLLSGVVIVLLLHMGTLTQTTFRTVLLATVMGELLVITLVAVNMSATAVSREREDGTLDLLLTTPITPAKYLSGKLQGMMAYLLPMLAVPLFTLLVAGLYVGIAGALETGAPGATSTTQIAYTSAAMGGASQAPLVLPEAGVVGALSVIPFIALCVMIGMSFSLRSRGVLGSVAQTVGVVGVVAGMVGLCAWRAAADVPLLGPVLAALNPAAAIVATIQPEVALQETVVRSTGGMGAARTALIIGGLVSLAIHAAIIYGLVTAMTRNFDQTVRRLAGIK